ncbi:MAG: hypothetical protein WC379_17960 [Methanoregula sp.]|jgi:predicted nucleic acid-binding protein
MVSRYRYVTDASILFDVVNGGVVHEMFQLPCIFLTSDLIADIELKNPPFSEFRREGLRKKELSKSQAEALSEIRKSHKNLSVYDISAFILARDQKIILLSGDDALRKFALLQGVEVHGILWIMDQLIAQDLLRKQEAARALQQIITHNSYLPKKECADRIARWSE